MPPAPLPTKLLPVREGEPLRYECNGVIIAMERSTRAALYQAGVELEHFTYRLSSRPYAMAPRNDIRAVGNDGLIAVVRPRRDGWLVKSVSRR